MPGAMNKTHARATVNSRWWKWLHLSKIEAKSAMATPTSVERKKIARNWNKAAMTVPNVNSAQKP